MTEKETAFTAQGFAHCAKPERYIQQLVSHWSHKMATSYDEGDGMGCERSILLAVIDSHTVDHGVGWWHNVS